VSHVLLVELRGTVATLLPNPWAHLTKQKAPEGVSCFVGGAEGIRTPDPLHAMQVRYQLRHSPEPRLCYRSFIDRGNLRFSRSLRPQVIFGFPRSKDRKTVVDRLWLQSFCFRSFLPTDYKFVILVTKCRRGCTQSGMDQLDLFPKWRFRSPTRCPE
jgi:hypothetical protein